MIIGTLIVLAVGVGIGVFVERKKVVIIEVKDKMQAGEPLKHFEFPWYTVPFFWGVMAVSWLEDQWGRLFGK